MIGTWKSHVRRLQKPLTGSTSWIEGDATVSARKIWNGRGDLEEIELTTPAGHLEGMTLRLYDPQARQWRLYWANASQGVLTSPVSIGEFRDGRGEFYDQETINGKIVLVRHRFSGITPKSYHFEQAFSADRGQTWEANWIADVTRTSDEPIAPSLSAEDRNRDFDFNIGHWDVEVKRLANPLSGDSKWTDWKGTGEVAPVWKGRGSVAEFELDGPTGHLQGVGLRITIRKRSNGRSVGRTVATARLACPLWASSRTVAAISLTWRNSMASRFSCATTSPRLRRTPATSSRRSQAITAGRGNRTG